MGDFKKSFQTKVLAINKYLSSFISDRPPKLRRDVKYSKDSKTHPGNQAEFEMRLSSFEYGTWMLFEISPLQCSRNGWIFHGTNMLHCTTCKSFLSTDLPSPCQREAYTHAVGELKIKLKDHHKMWCGWKDNSSPIEFTMPPLTLSVHYLNELRDHISDITTLQNKLPYFSSEDILNKLNIGVDDLKVLLQEADFNPTNVTSALLALCGWRITKNDQLRCNMCLRSIGLWNFYFISDKHKYETVEKAETVIREKTRMQARKLQLEQEAAKAEEVRRLELEQQRREAERELQEDRLLEGTDSLPESDVDEAELMQQPEKYSTTAKSIVIDIDNVCGELKPGDLTGLDTKEDESEKVSIPSVPMDFAEPPEKSEADEDLWSAALGCINDVDESAETSSSNSIFQEVAQSTNDEETLQSNGYQEENCERSSDCLEGKKNSTPVCPIAEKFMGDTDEGSSDNTNVETCVSNKRKRSSSDDDGENSKKKAIIISEESSDSSDIYDISEEETIIKENSKILFDPIQEHRFWCGIVAPVEGVLCHNLKGFMVIPSQLKTFQSQVSEKDLVKSEKYAKNVEGVRAVRTILETSIH